MVLRRRPNFLLGRSVAIGNPRRASEKKTL